MELYVNFCILCHRNDFFKFATTIISIEQLSSEQLLFTSEKNGVLSTFTIMMELKIRIRVGSQSNDII